MSNRITNGAKRRLEILERAASTYDGNEMGVLLNRKWCFALSTEPAMKFLLKRKYLTLSRESRGSSGRCNATMAYITDEGREYLNSLRKQKDKALTGLKNDLPINPRKVKYTLRDFLKNKNRKDKSKD